MKNNKESKFKNMNPYEQKLKQYLQDKNIPAEHLSFDASCHSVADAAKALNANPDEFIKNICLIDQDDNLIVAIVKGEDKVDSKAIAEVLGISEPKICRPEQILEKSGYPVGGTPSFGYSAIFLVDPRVIEKEIVYSGGGSPTSVLKIQTSELLKANQAKVVKIRK